MMRTRTAPSNRLIDRRARQKDSENNQTLFSYHNIKFTRHDLRSLTPPRFLNDTIISLFIQLYLDQHVEEDLKQRIHVFSSFFFEMLKRCRHYKDRNSSTPSYLRWVKDINIFDKDFLIMPVCEQEHWTLIIVCYPANAPKSDRNKIPDEELYEPAVLVLNSANGIPPPAVKKSLSQFLKFQWQRERGSTERTFSINNAKRTGIRLVYPELPQQKNNYNCGVYLLGYFYSFLRNPRLAYLKMFRKRNLTAWFTDNNIDIQRERRKMTNMINEQIASWQRKETQSTGNGADSQETHIGDSPQSNTSTCSNDNEDKTEANGSKESVIVLA